MRSLFIIICLFFSLETLCQDTANINLSNSVYIELLGNAILPSFNYERRFYKNESLSFIARIGFTPIHPKGVIDTMKIVLTLFIPITGSIIIGKKDNKFELGIGADIAPLPDDQFALPHPEILGVGIIGYRYEPTGKIFLLRIDYTPLFGRLGPNWGHIKNAQGYGVYYHFGGISLGKRF